MTTEKQIQANRLNALKGGVKTEEGKAAVRLNAPSHGFFCNEVLTSRHPFTSPHRPEKIYFCENKPNVRHEGESCAIQKMREDPSEPPCRWRLQTTLSCCGQKPW